jgi:uncharacterized protein (UPF0297 family)
MWWSRDNKSKFTVVKEENIGEPGYTVYANDRKNSWQWISGYMAESESEAIAQFQEMRRRIKKRRRDEMISSTLLYLWSVGWRTGFIFVGLRLAFFNWTPSMFSNFLSYNSLLYTVSYPGMYNYSVHNAQDQVVWLLSITAALIFFSAKCLMNRGFGNHDEFIGPLWIVIGSSALSIGFIHVTATQVIQHANEKIEISYVQNEHVMFFAGVGLLLLAGWYAIVKRGLIEYSTPEPPHPTPYELP